MVAAFFAFALSEPPPRKNMGTVLGGAVLLEAFLVRLLLRPGLPQLTGNRLVHPAWLPKVLPDLTFSHR